MCLYLRYAYFFRVNMRAGSLLIITVKLFSDMAFFTALTAVVVGGSAILMDTILRQDYVLFKNFGESFFTLVYAALGKGDFLENQSGGLDLTQFFGNFVYFIFLMFVALLLLNLLIAIMNNSFDSWTEHGKVFLFPTFSN